MATCFNPFRLRRSKGKLLELPSSSSITQWNSSDVETMNKKRFDSLESWSMILESDNVERWEVSKEDQEKWTTDLSQLFIGNKFASGAHSRIYRGIYKQRAVIVKIVRIPTLKEETKAKLEQQFQAEVLLLSHLYHLNIVQVVIHLHYRMMAFMIFYHVYYPEIFVAIDCVVWFGYRITLI
ncbi:Serine/threonine-protein kinase HT1 [Capsicum annuum]|uniref:Serine/threonine-protein kinase HT1 n=1 Tax=Capsicum annuum TaxID=4072 RepID=A0A2G2ZI47_CAPAN|nr:Serine/threonine-protein kinase HT1 [Capsicum annuum]